MDSFLTLPWSFRLFMGENLPPYDKVMQLEGQVTLGGGLLIFTI
jgi:hypothetical protein